MRLGNGSVRAPAAAVTASFFPLPAGVGLLACLVPARRATAVNPIEALRAE